MQGWTASTVCLTSQLVEQGYSRQLISQYKNAGWLDAVGTGAVKRHNDKVDYYGGLYALQNQAGLDVHIGGRSALALQGRAHYLNMASSRVILFGNSGEKLPTWFRKYDWGEKVDFYATSFLSDKAGLVDHTHESFTVKVSGPARAIMECLYLAPKHQELFECLELMEGLNNLRPKTVQRLINEALFILKCFGIPIIIR